MKKKEKLTHRICPECQKDKNIPNEIYQIGKCYDCIEKNKIEKQIRINKQLRPCKKCKNLFEVSKMKTFFICDECNKKKKEQQEIRKCKKCGKDFHKDISDKKTKCSECRSLKKIKNTRICFGCKKELSVEMFDGRKLYCKECIKKTEEESKELSQQPKKQFCHYCNQIKIVGTEINKFATKCKKCSEEYQIKRHTKKINVERECINTLCKKKFIAENSRKTFAYCPECKQKREELRRQKLINYLENLKKTICFVCRKEFIKENKQKHICKECNNDPNWKKKYRRSLILQNDKYLKKCLKCENDFWVEKEKIYIRHFCDNCQQKRLHRDLPLYKNNFSYRGTTSDGHKFSSLHEQDVDEWLFFNNIKHEPHPKIGTSVKHADQYLPDYQLYLEIDGLDRKDDVDWYGKLSLYKDLKISYKIIKPVSKHYFENKEECFQELDKQFDFLKL